MPDRKVSQLNELTSSAVDLAADMLHIVDTSAVESKKISARNLLDGSLPAITAGNVDPNNDTVILFDTSAGSSVRATVTDLVKKLITEQQTFTTGWEAVTTANGWSGNGNASHKTISHNLGTTDFQLSVYGAADHNGTDAVWINGSEFIYIDRMRTKQRFGASIHSITASTLTVQLAMDGYAKLNSDGDNLTNLNWAWIKILCKV
jgi:molybdopterin-binding protein